jgi:hypothetical protein
MATSDIRKALLFMVSTSDVDDVVVVVLDRRRRRHSRRRSPATVNKNRVEVII